jgi:hypothetical protein
MLAFCNVVLAPPQGIREHAHPLQFELEEDVYWQESTNTFEWVFGQQTEFHLVQPKKGGDNNPKSGLGTSSTSLSLVEGLGKLLGWHFARWL